MLLSPDAMESLPESLHTVSIPLRTERDGGTGGESHLAIPLSKTHIHLRVTPRGTHT